MGKDKSWKNRGKGKGGGKGKGKGKGKGGRPRDSEDGDGRGDAKRRRDANGACFLDRLGPAVAALTLLVARQVTT